MVSEVLYQTDHMARIPLYGAPSCSQLPDFEAIEAS